MTLTADLLANRRLEPGRSRPDLAIPGSPARCISRRVVEDASGAAWVLERIPAAGAAGAEASARLLAGLAEAGLDRIAPYPATTNGNFILSDWSGHWRLSPFVRGVPLRRSEFLDNEAMGEDMGAFLAALSGTEIVPPNGLFHIHLPAYQAVDKFPLASLLRKSQTLAYVMYSAALLIRKSRRLANGSRSSTLTFSCAYPEKIFNRLLCGKPPGDRRRAPSGTPCAALFPGRAAADLFRGLGRPAPRPCPWRRAPAQRHLGTKRNPRRHRLGIRGRTSRTHGSGQLPGLPGKRGPGRVRARLRQGAAAPGPPRRPAAAGQRRRPLPPGGRPALRPAGRMAQEKRRGNARTRTGLHRPTA